VTPADLERVRANYEQVADIVETFPQMRPGMVGLLVDGAEHLAASELAARALAAFGLPTIRHVVSVARTPGYILQLVTQLEATFPRMVLVAVGAANSALPAMLDSATANPIGILNVENPHPDELALACAKAFALEDTVVFGRVLLLQANARSEVLGADAKLNAPPPAPAPGAALA
jgi:phosphoribosylcarboxyaminoimidazole (NCAIR) mutase